jgi:hypothetical protein
MVTGSFPFRPTRLGWAEIRCQGPSLWFHVVPALGFTIYRARVGASPFFDVLGNHWPSVRFVRGCLRLRNNKTLPQIVFCDLSILPDHTAVDYWAHWLVPHVFWHAVGTIYEPVGGWSLRSIKLPHSDAGGCTTAVYFVSLLLPPGMSNICPPPPFPTQPWRPLDSMLSSVIAGPPAQVPSEAPTPRVCLPMYSSVSPQTLLPWGLLPAEAPLTPVFVRCVYNKPTAWTCRTLTPMELSGAWDVPILFQEWARDSGCLALLSLYVSSPPGKILECGTDYLISNFHRGGFDSLESGASCYDPSKRALQYNPVPFGLSDVRPTKRPHTAKPQPSCATPTRAAFPPALPPIPQEAPPNFSAKEGKPSCATPTLAAFPPALPPIPQEAPPNFSAKEGRFFLSVLPDLVKTDGQKPDDSEIPYALWDKMFVEFLPAGCCSELAPRWRDALSNWRKAALIWWKRRVVRSFWNDLLNRTPRSQREKFLRVRRFISFATEPMRWSNGLITTRYRWRSEERDKYVGLLSSVRSTPEQKVDFEAAADCVRYSGSSSWWEWDGGSRLFFWRWPGIFRSYARDGQPHLWTKTPAPFRRPQQPPKSPGDAALIADKVGKLRYKGYMKPEDAEGLVHYFYVKKGSSDIRVVFDGTSCGLNTCLFTLGSLAFNISFAAWNLAHISRTAISGRCSTTSFSTPLAGRTLGWIFLISEPMKGGRPAEPAVGNAFGATTLVRRTLPSVPYR